MLIRYAENLGRASVRPQPSASWHCSTSFFGLPGGPPFNTKRMNVTRVRHDTMVTTSASRGQLSQNQNTTWVPLSSTNTRGVDHGMGKIAKDRGLLRTFNAVCGFHHFALRRAGVLTLFIILKCAKGQAHEAPRTHRNDAILIAFSLPTTAFTRTAQDHVGSTPVTHLSMGTV